MARPPNTIRALALLSVALSPLPADARLVRLELQRPEMVAGGQPFGAAGAYERLTGAAYFEVDPQDPRNALVFDLDKAPRNARGRVEFSAEAVILKPVDLAKASGTLFFEVNNRGNKISFGRMQDTGPSANVNAPVTAQDFGNGFLMKRGYVLAWIGWGADIAPGDNRLTVSFPIAMRDGQPITERILTEFGDRNFNGGRPTTLPLSGGTAFKSFTAASTNKEAAQAELWAVESDSPRPSGPGIPRGTPVLEREWAFAHCPDGWPGVPSATDICLKGGLRNDLNYHLIYRAAASPVMGLGYVTSRDFVSFLRHGVKDDSGRPNPVVALAVEA